jgi:hypothetical protein
MPQVEVTLEVVSKGKQKESDQTQSSRGSPNRARYTKRHGRSHIDRGSRARGLLLLAASHIFVTSSRRTNTGKEDSRRKRIAEIETPVENSSGGVRIHAAMPCKTGSRGERGGRKKNPPTQPHAVRSKNQNQHRDANARAGCANHLAYDCVAQQTPPRSIDHLEDHLPPHPLNSMMASLTRPTIWGECKCRISLFTGQCRRAAAAIYHPKN